MYRFLSFSLIFIFFSAVQPSFAQDVKAKAILEAASQKMKSLKTLKATFSLKLLGAGGKVKDTQKGTFIMKGNKYHITLKNQEIICDGTTVWTFMKDANEVQISKYNPEEQSISPMKLFTNFYDKEYSYHFIGTKMIGTKSCNLIEMNPNKTKQFSKVELAFDKTNSIAGGTISEKNGNQYQYEVGGFTPNAALLESQFIFNAKEHPGVEVVDLR